MTATARYTPLFGRIFLSLIFIVSGFGKLLDFGGTAGYMETYGIPMPSLLLVFAILFELGGGALLLIGFQARLAATALIVFTVLATLIFHDFWALAGAEREMQFINFMKNLSMIGGLLLVVGFGSGPISLDRDRPD